jgi:uncharacterized membrane protein
MAFCANCGNEVVGRFCAKCGAPAPAAAPPPPAQPQGQPQAQPQGGYAPPQGQPQGQPQGGYAPPPPGGGYAPPPPGGGYQQPGGGYQQQGGYAPPQGGGYQQPQGAYAPAQSGLADNMAAALCYITIIGIVFLFIEPYNRNRTIRFHAFQSIFFFVAAFVAEIAATILSIALSALPLIGFVFGALLHFVLGLGIFILWLLLLYKAYNNETWVLPVIGPMAQKQV